MNMGKAISNNLEDLNLKTLLPAWCNAWCHGDSSAIFLFIKRNYHPEQALPSMSSFIWSFITNTNCFDSFQQGRF